MPTRDSGGGPLALGRPQGTSSHVPTILRVLFERPTPMASDLLVRLVLQSDGARFAGSVVRREIRVLMFEDYAEFSSDGRSVSLTPKGCELAEVLNGPRRPPDG